MKVDVNIIKRPGVKVDVTLARGSRRGRRVTIPVRVAPYLAEETEDSFVDELFADVFAEEEALLPEAQDDADALPEEPEAEEEAVEDIPAEEPAVTEDIAEERDPDEEELLRLIAEEEAEMAAAAKSGAKSEAQTEAQKAEEYEPAAPEQAEPKPDSHYMSYIDRTDDGGIREVDDTHAAGQKIVCVSGESGRISRVCGFIRNNSAAEDPALPSVDDPLPEELFDMIDGEEPAGE